MSGWPKTPADNSSSELTSDFGPPTKIMKNILTSLPKAEHFKIKILTANLKC